MKLWGGRFEKKTAEDVDEFNSSINVDCQMVREDILGSIAHARMLGRQGIISTEDAKKICTGLEHILEDVQRGKVKFQVEAEDIHMNVENLLTERIGETAKKLHTGRSRNDQVALDLRMVSMKETEHILSLLAALESELLSIAEENTKTYMPGYTHLQKAQPITLAHYLLAYFEMFRRDIEHLKDCRKRTNVMPLGSGALAGTTYPLDREWVADNLGFDDITRNSLDGVSDRDFAIEALCCCSVIMMHLSRFCEELILWSTDEFRFVEMDDSYSTGSSIMPQKKNPDVAELIRGKTGRVYGDLITLLTMMKGIPLAYNKDMQEDKEALFDGFDTVQQCLHIFTDMISTITFKQSFLVFLVRKGIPFRTAHEITGRLVLYCIRKNKALLDLRLEELQSFSPLFGEDIYEALSLETCVNQRKLPGGPAPETVQEAIRQNKTWLSETFPGTSSC